MSQLEFDRQSFPRGFQFGVAGSSYQIEGHSFGGAGKTHWDSFAATPGNVIGSADGAIACDHFHRFESDLRLAASAGFDVWRFSASWARIFPDGHGKVNSDGLDFYDRLVDAICENGMLPNLTLYHWELPSSLADIGGWANPDIASYFAIYAEKLLHRIGDRIHYVAPINEPWCIAWLGHFTGHHAPGIRDIRATARAMHHVPLAHGLAVQAIRSACSAKVGLVVNLEFSQPADSLQKNLEAAELYDEIYNQWFLRGILHGYYPSKALAGLEAYMPLGWENDFGVISQPIDWIGINYYTRKLIAQGSSQKFGDFDEIEGDLPKTQMGWEIYSKGLLHFLVSVWDNFADGLPIFVTENGMAYDNFIEEGSIEDIARIEFVNSHLKAVCDAIEYGVDVKGYYLWTFMDNYEWSLGYDKHFGIVHIDRETMKRTPKKSYFALKKMLLT